MTNLFVRADNSRIDKSSILSCEYSEIVNTSEDFCFGGNVCSAVKVVVRGNPDGVVTAGEALSYYQVSEAGVETKVATMYADKPTIETKDSFSFYAYDAIWKLDKDLSEWLRALNEDEESFPMSLLAFAQAVCGQCGVTLSTTNFPNKDYQVKAFYSDNLTGRDLMGMVAELAGRFLKCDVNGNLTLAWFTNASVEISPSKGAGKIAYYEGGLSYQSYETAEVERVQIRTTDEDIGIIYPADGEGVTYAITENLLLSGASDDEKRQIAQTLLPIIQTMVYTPFTVKFGKTSNIHAGEWVTVTDIHGNSFTSPIFKLEMDSSGITLETSGNTSRDSSSAVNEREYSNLRGQILTLKATSAGLKVMTKDLENNLSEVSQEADKISWLIESGTSSTQFTLTSKAVELATQNIKLSTKPIPVSDVTVYKPDGATYGFKMVNGAYVSQTQGVDSSIAHARMTFTANENFTMTIRCLSSGEQYWDYGYIGMLDTELALNALDDGSKIYRDFKASGIMTSFVDVQIAVTAGSHFIDFKFRKDGSGNEGEDCFKFYPPDPDGSYMTIQNGETVLNSASIVMRGGVTFSDLAGEGSTIINGSNITTGTIKGVTLLTEKILGTKDGYTYYGVTEVTGGGVKFYSEKRNGTTVTSSTQIAEIMPNYKDDTYSAYYLMLEAKGINGIYMSGGTNGIIMKTGELWVESQDGASSNITLTTNGGGIYLSGSNIRFNTTGDVNTGCGTAGQVLKSNGKNYGCYWGDGLSVDLLYNTPTRGKAVHNAHEKGYKAIIVTAYFSSTGTRCSTIIPTSVTSGRYQIVDENHYLSFNVYENYITFAQSGTAGSSYAWTSSYIAEIYGIK